MKFSGWPEKGELVVGTVDEIADFGVFIDLDEYEDKRGLVHISDMSWTRRIHHPSEVVRKGEEVSLSLSR